jgi:hypothetical protein
MAKYAIKTDGDGFVSGKWQGRGPDIPEGMTEVSEADHQKIDRTHIQGTTAKKFKMVDGKPIEQADQRPVGTWSHEVVDLAVGDPDFLVTLTVDPPRDGNDLVIQLNSGNIIKPNFVNGAATITIKTDAAGKIRATSSPEIRFSAPLQIRISEADILRPV